VSNRSALAVALNRQSEALDHIGARASAVELRRELSELLGQLGIAHDDLWPTSSPPPSDQAEGVIRGPDDRSKSLLNSFT
jgi:hypothetical protein